MAWSVSRRARRRSALLIALLVCVSVGAAAAYGPLLPWSPMHPGYLELRSKRARVLYGTDTTLPAVYNQLDELIAEAEQFHRYSAPARLTVIVCRSWADFRRFVPWLGRGPVGAVTLATGDTIYITPKLNEGGRDHGEFLRHELSHAVLAQNTSIRNTFRFQKQEWAYEGLAVWFGRQQTYITQEEFLARARQEGVAVHLGVPVPESQRVDIRYRYVAWRNFFDYLDRRHGHTAVIRFIHAVNRDPSTVEHSFAGAFSTSLAVQAAAFERAVLDGRYIPDRMFPTGLP